MSSLSPVVVFAYNRPDHIIKTLEALNRTKLCEQTDLYIYCDGWKNPNTQAAVQEVWKAVDEFAKLSNFRNTYIEKSPSNKGLAKSIISGVSQVISQYGKVIVLEDDLVVSNFFLRYMNDALDYYSNNKEIWAISGYSFPMKALNTYKHDIFYSGRACSWGWATWENRWVTVDWDVSDYKSFCHNWIKRYQFSRWGFDLPLMLDRQVNAGNNSWAIRWCYQAFKSKSYTIYPKISFLKNIGLDGSGTHISDSNSTHKYSTEVYSKEEYKIHFEKLGVDNTIRKEFARTYSYGRWIDIKAQIKGVLLRMRLIPYK